MSVLSAASALDNTVLSRFAIIDRFDLLEQLTRPALIVASVQTESRQRRIVGAQVGSAMAAGWLAVDTVRDLSGLLLLRDLRRTLGRGESESIAYLASRGGTFVTDDFKAYEAANGRGLRVVSSLWLLYQAVQGSLTTSAEFDAFTRRWMDDGQIVVPRGATYASASRLFAAGTSVASGGLF